MPEEKPKKKPRKIVCIDVLDRALKILSHPVALDSMKYIIQRIIKARA